MFIYRIYYISNNLFIPATLDEPEAFLLEMTKMAQFTERIECLTFRKNFNESLFDIGMSNNSNFFTFKIN